MWVGRKRFLSSLVLIAALLLSSVTLAQATTVLTGDWTVLKTIASGSNLVVKLRNGKTVKGKLSSVSDTEAGVYELADLAEADEIFLTSASLGVALVTTFDFRQYSVTAGNVCARLSDAFKNLTLLS